ncbi:sporulation protein [Thermoflavimicrobium dichotomicum]|uniref:Sporulation-control protein n=1 Tax=Thermoflavimicrobium dichotomicum TaxID=46223 RepID=A0A1I3R6R5_9BACL|nr:sporulation protein [Thermoflavimicrobium dichotomicum]SFJ41339.1 sporulation-control protein [Thermoflavimicrobium dichotomicum]
MYNHVVATVLMGSAKADTLLEKTQFRQGEVIKGYINLEGGLCEQIVRGMNISLVVENRLGSKKTQTIWQKVQVCEQVCLTPKESRILPFSIQVPEMMPISFANRFSVYLKTQLYIHQSCTFRDDDVIEILPHPYVETVFQVLTRMGFPLIWMNTNWMDYSLDCPFYQEYKFGIPYPYHFYLSEFAITYLGNGDFILQVDKRVKGLMTEKKYRFTMTERDLKDDGDRFHYFLTKMLYRFIEEKQVM